MTKPIGRDDTHGCPGGCGARVPHHRLACPSCWYRLPLALRDEVNSAWRARGRDPRRHQLALREATAWYRANPLNPQGTTS